MTTLAQLCCVCRFREATRLCDQPIGRRSGSRWGLLTCDAPLCDGCAYEIWNSLTPRVDDDTWDQCPEHARQEVEHDLRESLTEEEASAVRAEVHQNCRSALRGRGDLRTGRSR